MEELYLRRPGEFHRDRARAPQPGAPGAERTVHPTPGRPGGSASRAAASALRIGNTVSAALTNRRVLGASEAGVMAKFGTILLALALLGLAWPMAVAAPLAILGAWIGVSLLARAWKLRRRATGEAPEHEKPGASERRS